VTAEATEPDSTGESPLLVFRNAGFLRLWLSQAATQIGGNMVLFGLTVLVVDSTKSSAAVSVLVLTFLVPAVLFSAVAGVYVDRFDRRIILVATNLLRGLAFVALYLVGTQFALILLLNFTISTITVFFAPAELAMIPVLVPRRQLLAANGIFTLTLNGAFAIGFALLGPLVVNVASPEAVILVVAALYFLAAVFCFTLPSAPPAAKDKAAHHGLGVGEAEKAVASTLAELKEGFGFIQTHRNIGWSLLYLAIAASLVGVLGVLGPRFAQDTLGLQSKDFAVVVLPLGFGIVMGILLLNSYGKYFPRRRVIEGGMIVLGILLATLSAAGPISRLLQRADAPGGLDLSGVTSLLAVVVVIAFFAGIAYGLVAIPSQTQLQEDLPEDVRGRVFGVLGMLVSVASFVPIIIAGGVADLIGTTAVIFAMAIAVTVIGVISVLTRGPLKETDARPAADPKMVDPLASALGADLPTWTGHGANDQSAGEEIYVPPLEVPAVPMPVGPAGDMLVPTGAEPDDRVEVAAATAPPLVPGQEPPDQVDRG
jgi:MFS family permease